MIASGSLGCTVWILQVTPGLNYGEWPHRIQHGSSYLVQARRPLPGSVPLARLLPAALWLGSRDSNGSSGGGGRGGRECLREKEETRPRGLEAPREWRYPGPGQQAEGGHWRRSDHSQGPGEWGGYRNYERWGWGVRCEGALANLGDFGGREG